MSRENWELASWISTTVASALAVVGIAVVAVQLYWQRRQTRLEFLDRLYGEFDTHEARLARQFIYEAPADKLRMKTLHSEEQKENRQKVEDTLAMLERIAYPIVQEQVPSEDAFNLYGGVLLSLAHRLWPYIEDQREFRRKGGLRHRLGYRKYLESVVKLWAPKYAATAGLPLPDTNSSTGDLLKALFPPKSPDRKAL